MTTLPELDISTIEAAKKSVRALESWRSGRDVLPKDIDGQYQRTRLAVENMGFKNAQESEVMRGMAHEEIEKLKAVCNGAEQ